VRSRAVGGAAVAFPEFDVRRRQAGQGQLTSKLILTFEQRDVVAAGGGLERAAAPRRAAADNEDRTLVVLCPPPQALVRSRPVRAFTAQPIGTPA